MKRARAEDMTETRRNVLKLFGLSVVVTPPLLTEAIKPLTAQPPVYFGDIVSPDLTFRLAGEWGAGKGTPLTPQEVDMNFWLLHKRIEHLESLLAMNETGG